MQRTLDVSGKSRTIHTVNGVDTKTAAVYLRDLKPYDKPLENGFNAELGEDMWHQLVTAPKLWDQGTWRSAFHLDEVTTELTQAVRERVNAPKKETKCGTVMCAAGWVDELAGADWVVDNLALQSGGNLNSYSELVLLPLADWKAWSSRWEISRDTQLIETLSAKHQDQLRERGFTDATHVIVSAMVYSLVRLGLQDDYVGMYSANNGYPAIRAKLDAYIQFGDLSLKDQQREIVEARHFADEREEVYTDEIHQDFGGDHHRWALATLEREPVDA